MKNRILLENYYLPGQLEQSIGEFVEHYNNRRYHESLDNLTPADVYFGRAPAILKRRETIKRKGHLTGSAKPHVASAQKMIESK
jgi:putative transposase